MVAKSGAACAGPCGPVTDVPLLRPDADSAGVLCPGARPPAVWLAAGAARCVTAAKLALAEMLTCAGAPCSPCNTPGNSKAGGNMSPLGFSPHGCLRAQPLGAHWQPFTRAWKDTTNALIHSVPARNKATVQARRWRPNLALTGQLLAQVRKADQVVAERILRASRGMSISQHPLGLQAHTASKHGVYAHRRANRGHQIIHLHVRMHICRR